MKIGQLMKVMVAVDGSRNSLRAGKLAVNLAKKTGSRLIVVSVITTPPYAISGSHYFATERKKTERWIGQILNLARSGHVKVSTQILLSVSVVKSLLDYAASKNVDLIVVGTRGLGTFKRLAIGSVSSALVNHSRCSVLVVR